jgi:hypothetical protein
MNALMKARTQDSIGRHDVDSLEARYSCEQIEINRSQPMWIRNPVGDGQDDVPQRIGGGGRQQVDSQAMLVDGVAEATFVRAECRRQKARLVQQARRSPIGIVEALDEQFLKSIDALTLPPELIVETQHLGDQARTHVKRRHGSGSDGFVSRRVQQDLALAWRQPPRRRGEPGVEAIVELVSCDQLGRGAAEHATKLVGGSARRHHNSRHREQIVLGVGGKNGDRAPQRM